MEYTHSEEIKAPPSKVFEYLNDEKKMKLWMPELVSVEYTTPHDIQQPKGTKFIQKLKEGGRVQSYNGEVTAFLKDKNIGVRLGNKMFDVDVNYHLTGTATGTRLDYRCSVQHHSLFARILGILFWWFMKKTANKHMVRLKAAAEAGK